MPPDHGAAIVAHLLANDALANEWRAELDSMRLRIQQLRCQFADTMAALGHPEFQFVANQKGMFSYTGLSKEHVQQLRDKHHIYMVGSGRVNVAGLNTNNIDYVVNAIADVLK